MLSGLAIFESGLLHVLAMRPAPRCRVEQRDGFVDSIYSDSQRTIVRARGIISMLTRKTKKPKKNNAAQHNPVRHLRA